MYNNIGSQPGVQPPPNTQPNPFGSAFQVAGSGLIRGGLGAYGGKILGSSSEYVQSNVRTCLIFSAFCNINSLVVCKAYIFVLWIT